MTTRIKVRRAAERGRFDFGWLDTRHTFSFGEFHDPRHMGYRSLRVINDDRVSAGGGFPTHAHRDMEILTYVIEGALEHADSMGNGSVIRPGDVQRMSAGTGVRHSEKNPSPTESVRLLQIWIVPERTGLAPSYEQKRFGPEEKRGRLRLLASPEGREGSVVVHQNACVYGAILNGETLRHELAEGRGAWVQIVGGEVVLDGTRLEEGDGATVEGGPLALSGGDGAELLLFDLA